MVTYLKENTDLFSWRTATTVVIANMIGTGIFTSLGFQLNEFSSPSVIIFLWVLGGIVALSGALCYAEIGARLPRSGGEYNFVREIYHPAAGFVSGWISVTVGFSAPTAAVAITACSYLRTVFPTLPVSESSVVLVLLIGLIHLSTRENSAKFQEGVTFIKIAFIFLFIIVAALAVDETQNLSWTLEYADLSSLSGGALAVTLIFVNYAYTGWNAATYFSGEMSNPGKNLPRSLLLGTAFVTFIYVILNLTFLYVAPVESLAGQVEVGAIVANHALGLDGARVMSVILGALLVSTISAMTLSGPRAMQAIGEDFVALRLLSKTNTSGIPYVAICVQMALAILMILTSSFEQIVVFSGALLALNSLVTVIGAALLRRREGTANIAFKMPLYPLPVMLYAGVISLTLIYALQNRPSEGIAALIVILFGLVIYFMLENSKGKTLFPPR